MATQVSQPRRPVVRRPNRFMRGSASNRSSKGGLPIGSSQLQACCSRRSADLAGRAVALSGDVPAIFDQPLGPHHKLIGRWTASRETPEQPYTRVEARRRIERSFGSAVLDILAPVEMADLRTVVLRGQDDMPPAIGIFCDSMGQLDLGWIETSDAPIPWRAAAYAALEQTLGSVLPVFAYQDLFDEMSLYYWEGQTDEAAARECVAACHGADPDDLGDIPLPSTMNERRPEWMIRENAARTRDLPARLRRALKTLSDRHRAIGQTCPDDNAWSVELDVAYDYLPGIEECSSMPPLTLVPVDEFAREVDDVAQHGMEMGFFDIAGLCPLSGADRIECWFASLRLGAEFLCAAQNLINLDPTTL